MLALLVAAYRHRLHRPALRQGGGDARRFRVRRQAQAAASSSTCACRALLALMVGAGLGIVGCLLPDGDAHDLADPVSFGLSSGAAAGAVFVITITGDLFGIWTLPAAAFTGGMAASSSC
ncbi:MAG: iron chelate uptake ABC transporter family permease subunit [Alphaproteobacteria bacterium]|nr:iron chelate uptake ABC transporter family permease subunit [Alphaproteobacteria bacterium]